jgi:3-phosphoshikimate 1-carboxyvinyltransferase
MTHRTLQVPDRPVLTAALAPSKSSVLRGLFAAALASGESYVGAEDFCDDVLIALEALAAIGIDIEWSSDRPRSLIRINGTGGILPEFTGQTLNLGNSGTAFRLMTALCCLGKGTVIIDGTDRMRERPVNDLVDALRSLGATIEGDHAPLTVHANGLEGGDAHFDVIHSSQSTTGLMLIAPYTRQGVNMFFPADASFSRGYLRLTAHVLTQFGVNTLSPVRTTWAAPPGARYQAREIVFGADGAASAALGTILAVAGGQLRVENVDMLDGHPEWECLPMLLNYGIEVRDDIHSLLIEQGEPYDDPYDRRTGFRIDGSTCIDSVPLLAVLAALPLQRERSTMISNIGHLVSKESDRIEGIRKLVEGVGGAFTFESGIIEIHPADQLPSDRVVLPTQEDHRLAFAATAAAAFAPEIFAVESPGAVTKSFPVFWSLLEKAGFSFTDES